MALRRLISPESVWRFRSAQAPTLLRQWLPCAAAIWHLHRHARRLVSAATALRSEQPTVHRRVLSHVNRQQRYYGHGFGGCNCEITRCRLRSCSRLLSTSAKGQPQPEERRPIDLSSILACFPPVICAAGYGSGVFQQYRHKPNKNTMIDLVFVVPDAEQWHRHNLAMNRSHYSFLGMFGSRIIAQVQEHHGARMYYNTLVRVDNKLIKYGVITVKDLLIDLTQWQWLYVAGRMHKPTHMFVPRLQSPRTVDEPDSSTMDEEIDHVLEAQRYNTRMAAVVALLLIAGKQDPASKVTQQEVLEAITALSYTGDPRMVVGENPDKVRNIVQGSFQELVSMYSGPFQDLGLDFTQGAVTIPVKRLTAELENLPLTLKQRLKESIDSDWELLCCGEETWTNDHAEKLGEALASIVRPASSTQSIKGLLTAGLVKSLLYSKEKLAKWIKGLMTSSR